MTTTLVMNEMRIADAVAASYNVIHLAGDKMDPSEVDVVPTDERTAACTPLEDGVLFQCDLLWWERASPAERIGLLCHELAHIDHAGHGAQFWEAVVDNFNCLRQSSAELHTVVGGDIDWREVVSFLINDPTTREVDHKSETAFERRLWLAEKLGFNGEVTPFTNCRIIVPQRHEEPYTRVYVNNIQFEDPGPRQLISYLQQNPHPSLSRRKNAYVVERYPVVTDGDELQAVAGDELLSLLHRSGHLKTTVEVKE